MASRLGVPVDTMALCIPILPPQGVTPRIDVAIVAPRFWASSICKSLICVVRGPDGLEASVVARVPVRGPVRALASGVTVADGAGTLSEAITTDEAHDRSRAILPILQHGRSHLSWNVNIHCHARLTKKCPIDFAQRLRETGGQPAVFKQGFHRGVGQFSRSIFKHGECVAIFHTQDSPAESTHRSVKPIDIVCGSSSGLDASIVLRQPFACKVVDSRSPFRSSERRGIAVSVGETHERIVAGCIEFMVIINACGRCPEDPCPRPLPVGCRPDDP